jgi:hypothetical protein
MPVQQPISDDKTPQIIVTRRQIKPAAASLFVAWEIGSDNHDGPHLYHRGDTYFQIINRSPNHPCYNTRGVDAYKYILEAYTWLERNEEGEIAQFFNILRSNGSYISVDAIATGPGYDAPDEIVELDIELD